MLLDPAFDQGSAAPRASASARLAGLSVGEAGRLIWRRRLVVLALALAGMVGAGVLGKILPPRYAATAQLYIDPRDLRVVDHELTPREGDSNSVVNQIESEARILVGTRVLRRVVEVEHLTDDPDFRDRPGLFARLGLAGAMPPAAEDAQSARDGAMTALGRSLAVRRLERTFIVEVTANATEAQKAARLANAVANAYLTESGETRADVARRATVALQSRLVELAERVRKAEQRVEDYKVSARLVGAKGQLVTEQQLTEVNAQLSAARARVADARARYDQVQDAGRRLADTGSIPEAVASQTIGALRSQYAQLRARQAELRDLGPRHPLLLSQAAQVQDVQRLITEEVGRIAGAAKNDLDRAKALETAVTANLDALKRQTLEDGGASVQLREFEREVEASRAVYQTFLNRSREISEQERLDTANARVVTVALPPVARSFPPRVGLLVALGGLGGLALGAYLALAPMLLGRSTIPVEPRAQAAPPAPAPVAPPAPAPVAPRAPILAAPLAEAPPSVDRTVEGPLSDDLPVLATLDADSATLVPLRRGRSVSLAAFGLPVLDPELRGGFAEALAGEGGRARRIAVVGPDAAARLAVSANLALALGPVLLVDADRAGRRLTLAAGRAVRAPVSRGGYLDEATFRLTDEGAVLVEAPGRDAGDEATQAILVRAYLEARPDLTAIVLDGPPLADGLWGGEPVDRVVVAVPRSTGEGAARAWIAQANPPRDRVAGLVEVA